MTKTVKKRDKEECQKSERVQEPTIEWYQARAKELGHIVRLVFRGWHKNGSEDKDSYFPEVVDNKYRQLLELLKIAKCPDCDGSGCIPRVVAEYEFHPPDTEFGRCQWCYERQQIFDSIKKE